MTPEEIQRDQYKLLIQARNFHYENFNKWMTYFYVAIGALFVAYYTLKSGDHFDPMLEYLLLALGIIVSLFWYWSCKGYYYWNINFITLVNNYEEKVLKLKEEERVYLVFANKNTQNNYASPLSGANISTSKVAILFAFVVSIFWSTLFFYNLLNSLYCVGAAKGARVAIALGLSNLLVIVISSTLPYLFLQSNHKHFPDLKIDQSKD